VPSESEFKVESKPDGTGITYSDSSVVLTTASPDLVVYAVEESEDEVKNPRVSWVLTGSIGDLTIQDEGRSAKLKILQSEVKK